MGSKRRGMVCSAQPEATEAGIDVLAVVALCVVSGGATVRTVLRVT